jgi:hypothetical protein
MAVLHYKSAQITNRDATPKVINNARTAAAVLRGAVATIETVSGDSAGSTYRFFSVPSNALVRDLLVYSDDIGTTTATDVGLYRTTADGGAVVDADFFASAVVLNAGALNGTDITHESAVFGAEDAEKPLWEALGLSSDPSVEYDVTATLTGAADAAATITLKMGYAI